MKPKESKLDPIIKEKWLTALRSGEYEQGKEHLKFGQCNTKHCCLGVLLEIVEPEGFGVSFGGYYYHRFKDAKTEQTGYPNQRKMMELGLFPSAFKKLAEMNDKGNMSFEQIADYIERHY